MDRLRRPNALAVEELCTRLREDPPLCDLEILDNSERTNDIDSGMS